MGGGCPEKPHLLLSPPNLSILCGILARALQVRLGSPGLGSSPKLHFPCHYGKGINLGQSQSGGFYNLWGAALSLAFLGVPKNPPLPFFPVNGRQTPFPTPGLQGLSRSGQSTNLKASCISEFPSLAHSRCSINVCSM